VIPQHRERRSSSRAREATDELTSAIVNAASLTGTRLKSTEMPCTQGVRLVAHGYEKAHPAAHSSAIIPPLS
jgi:hypothetical protein